MDFSYIRTIDWKPKLIGAGLVILGIVQIYYLAFVPYFDVANLDSLIVEVNFLVLRSYFLIFLVVGAGIVDIVLGVKQIMGDVSRQKIALIAAGCSLLVSLIFTGITYSFINSVDFITPEVMEKTVKPKKNPLKPRF